MSEEQPARPEAWGIRDREIAAALATIGLTPPVASLFNVIHYGLTVPPADLCRRAAARDYSIGRKSTVREIQATLDECLTKGWLQIIDEAALFRLRDEVRQAELLGPVYGYPLIDGVDFTHAGAEQWFRICQQLSNGDRHPAVAFCDVVRQKTRHYYLTKSRALTELGHWREDEHVVAIEGPVPTGPWRATWWRRFDQGFCLDIEHQMQWEGRCTSGGGHCFFTTSNLPFDVAHAKVVLDRHNISVVEWLALAGLEDPVNSCRIIRKMTNSGRERFGLSLTEAECRNGLQACLHNGWLRRVDELVVGEIHNMLRADSAMMPVPFNPERNWTDVEFSLEGAQLYRMISAEIFGQHWEEGLCVQDTYYREEHRYGCSAAGLAAVEQEYAESGETPRSSRTVPIGPWCVYWWERFPAGHRLKLTFGEP